MFDVLTTSLVPLLDEIVATVVELDDNAVPIDGPHASSLLEGQTGRTTERHGIAGSGREQKKAYILRKMGVARRRLTKLRGSFTSKLELLAR